MNNFNSIVRKEGALRGLIFGVVLLIVNILLIYCTAYWVKSPVIYFILAFIGTYVVQIGLAVFFSGSLRKKIGGYWSLKQASTGIFFILFVTYIISSGGRWLYFRLFDSAAMQKANMAAVNIRRQALEMSDRPQKDIDKTITDMQNTIAQGGNVTITRSLQEFLVSIILLFAVAAILGALYKREPPVYKNAE